MTKQVKLTEEQIKCCRKAKGAIEDMGDWENTKEGVDHWVDIVMRLDAMATHGTSDGKPWVEPEPEVIIDDQWAAVWPRRLVMVRDSDTDPWQGPYRLGSVDSDEWPFNIVDDSRYLFCRPCTPEEIAAYQGKQEQQAEPEIGEGYRAATEADQYREDRDIVLGTQWMKAIKGVFIKNARYRVPVDRIPTDEDAKGRPVVMAKRKDESLWTPAFLIEVDHNDPDKPFHVKIEGLKYSSQREQCRFPYPGEIESLESNA